MKTLSISRLIVGALAVSVAAVAVAESPAEPPTDLPPEFKQIIPRGTIASIDAPEFVSAKEAEIPDDAWILGVAFDGEARAYSLNLLNQHEIVNDRIGKRAFAAVW